MSGLVWQPSASTEVIPREVRGLLILVVVIALHVLPAAFVTMSSVALPNQDDVPVSFEMVDLPPELEAAMKSPEAAEPKKIEAPKLDAPKIETARPPEIKTPETKIAEAKPPAPPPAVLPTQVPPPPAPEAVKSPTTPLIPLPVGPAVAFDESKAKGEAPKDAYLSDRTSSAADHGPKNLPRGDPYMDKGRSKAIRYNEIRGEGNLPPLASEANSGSVKKEGSPDAGKGPDKDSRLPEEKAPLERPALKDPVEQKGLAKLDEKPAIPGGTKDVPDKQFLPPEPAKPETKTAKVAPTPDDEVLKNDPFGSAHEKVETKKSDLAEAKPLPVRVPIPEKIEPAQQKTESSEPAVTPAKKKNPNEELDNFAALLDGKGKTDGRGGDVGTKPGINAREGQKGHEGNGTLRPGHEDAVSDITTLNLDSSAEEDDDARFGKKYDPVSTYFKKIGRRIDTKWKAEIFARNRIRIVRGVVTMKIIVRRDGKLLECTEVRREPNSMPDEFVAITKIAIQAAADPLSDPFPHDLQSHETLERTFSFLY